jgi:GntR family transcriptional repressor for pyruvate dehydrogenase complex
MSVTDEAIEQIKKMIVSGELGPGDRLPKEDELAARLGLSRSSLREAVRALTFVRILDVRQGDGTYVTSLQPELLLEAVSFVVDFHQDDSVLQFLEVRRIVEPPATALAARLASAEALDTLERYLDPVVADLPPDEFVEIDRNFHRDIVSQCGNQVLVSLIESISGPIHRARVWRGMTDPSASRRTLQEHRGIFEALRRRDPDVAAARALVHIAGVQDWLRRATPLSEGPPVEPAGRPGG